MKRIREAEVNDNYVGIVWRDKAYKQPEDKSVLLEPLRRAYFYKFLAVFAWHSPVAYHHSSNVSTKSLHFIFLAISIGVDQPYSCSWYGDV